MQQNTKEWHEWRNQGIGSSDTPIILGLSPFSTAYQLWEKKAGLVEPDEGNYATQKGHLSEPIAREMYEFKTNTKASPQLAFSPQYPWLRASLDGFNHAERLVVEFKNNGKPTHEKALKGEIPDYYWFQIQHQMLCVEAKHAHYVSFDGEEIVVVDVLPQQDAYKKIIEETRAFWNLLKKKEPPPLADRDYKECDDNELLEWLEKYKSMKEIQRSNEKIARQIRDEIFKRMDHPRLKAPGVKVYQAYRSGQIDYKKIPELSGIDLEKYRKPGTVVKTIKLD